MLAALLCNQGDVTPPPAATAQRFGGGPFWRKYGYRKEDEEREPIVEPVLDLPAQEEIGEQVAVSSAERAEQDAAEEFNRREEEDILAILMLM